MLHNEILKGRRDIAKFANLDERIVDYLIDVGILPVFRLKNRTVLTTSRLVLDAIEQAAQATFLEETKK